MIVDSQGRTLTDQTKIERAFTQFFKELFSSTTLTNIIAYLDLVTPRITLSMNPELEIEITA